MYILLKNGYFMFDIINTSKKKKYLLIIAALKKKKNSMHNLNWQNKHKYTYIYRSHVITMGPFANTVFSHSVGKLYILFCTVIKANKCG